MAVRISTLSLHSAIAQSINRSQQRVMRLQRNLGDGRAIHAASDDPVQASAAMRYREQIRVQRQYERGIHNALSQLTASESALAEIEDVLGDILSLQATGASDSLGADGRRALAGQLEQQIELLVEMGNTRFGGVSLFGGRRTLEEPLVVERSADGKIAAIRFNPNGVDGELQRAVAPNVSLTINVTAADLFGQDGETFQLLLTLRDALEAGDGNQIRSAAEPLVQATDRTSQASAAIGSVVRRAEALKEMAIRKGDLAEEGRSEAEDLPAAKAMVEFNAAQAALEAALATGSQILKMSLLDYLR